MIPKECKRLAEVDFPIAEVSKHAAREKSIRHGHPSTLHLWWARRPLAACRAMLMALLLPDPCDKNCPTDFKEKARKILLDLPGHPVGWRKKVKLDKGLQETLFKFISDFANWSRSADPDYLKTSRDLVRATYSDELPLVVDPFAGGGAIPLEASRIRCETFASDLNPVSCQILKVMLEDVPRYGSSLVEQLREAGKKIKEKAEKELEEFYPQDSDGSMPIAYLWARTVQCEAPNCGAEIPLMRSFWLCKKVSRKKALRFNVKRLKNNQPYVVFEIFEPNSDKEVPGGTVSRAKAKCLCCGVVLPPERVRAQLADQHGGADVIFDGHGKRIGGARLLAVVTLKPNKQGRQYRLPQDYDYQAVWRAKKKLNQISKKKGDFDIAPIPDELTPVGGGAGAGRAFSFHKYGMKSFNHIFTRRQNLSLFFISNLINRLDMQSRVVSLALGKLVDLSNAICRWEPIAECPRNVFAAGRVKPAWDFAEGNPISSSSGSFIVCMENLIDGILSVQCIDKVGSIEVQRAQNPSLPYESAEVWFTDPPYYDAYPYADLSDAFFVWQKRALSRNYLINDPFNPENPLTPKDAEIVYDDSRSMDDIIKNKAFFEEQMGIAFSNGCRILKSQGIGCVIFAHKTTEGWEALLTGMINGGFTITASWPIATEQKHRLRAKESAALATSVHLVCRPRPEDAAVGDWANVLQELPKRVGDWMERLQNEGVRGADLVFACIGPALEIYSRYRKVETPDCKEVTLADYLEKVWEVVGRTALEQILGTEEARARNGVAGALEEDARLTALFLWTIQATKGGNSNGNKEDTANGENKAQKTKSKGYSLIFDVVRRFAQPLGINLPKWESRIIKTKKGVVRLLPISERADQLFGKDGAQAMATTLEKKPKTDPQLLLFPEIDQASPPKIRGRGRKRVTIGSDLPEFQEATTLDRVHAAMLLQAGGQPNALRALIKMEQNRGPEFLRLANALSALYPVGSEEKRLLDAMLVAVPR